MSSRPVIFQSCPTSKNQRRGRTAFCRPVPFFPKLAPHIRVKDRYTSSPAVPGSPPQSPAVFCRLPSFSSVFCRALPSPAVPRCPPPPGPSPIVPYHNMSQIVGLAVLPNDGRCGNLQTWTDGILSSYPLPGSWQSHRQALLGLKTAENTGLGSEYNGHMIPNSYSTPFGSLLA